MKQARHIKTNTTLFQIYVESKKVKLTKAENRIIAAKDGERGEWGNVVEGYENSVMHNEQGLDS